MLTRYCAKCDLTYFGSLHLKTCPECGGRIASELQPTITHYCGCGGVMERVPHLKCPKCGHEPFKSPVQNLLRDTYRQKCYNWEKTLKDYPGRVLTLQESKVLVHEVWRDMKHRVAGRATPEVTDGRGCRSAYGGPGSIKLPIWSRRIHVVLHETAHSLVGEQLGGWHSIAWCKMYLFLLERYAGVHAALPPFYRRMETAAKKQDQDGGGQTMNWGRSIDSYITSGRYHKEEILFTCLVCDKQVQLVVEVEYGIYELPDAAYCEVCQREMEEA